DVERTLKENTTHNELFGRALTVYDMPEFNYPNSEPWSRSIGRTEVFDPTYVPIVIIDADKELFVHPEDSTFKSMTFILKDSVHVFNNVRSSTKNYDEDKFQFRVSLRGDDNLYNRRVFKFRPSAYDPAFIRQILYGDLAHAVGNPAHESVSSRVYLKDGTGIGVYVLQEDVTSESFIRSTFYGEPDGTTKKFTLSPIYDCSTGADFNPDDPHHLAAFQNEDESDLKIELKGMMRKLVEIDVTNEEQVKNIDENWLDLDTLLKAMALEYLAGHWDSYWFLTSNFVTYHPAEETSGSKNNYSKYKYYFIDQDFDQTWSVGMSSRFDPETFPTKKYTEFVNKDPEYWRKVNEGEEAEPGTRVIINKLIGCDGLNTCPTKVSFENHLKSIVKHIFNPVALGRKVDGYKERLDEEMKWDETLPRLHKGTDRSYNFTYSDFVDGMEVGVSSPYGIMDWTKVITDTVCKQFNMDYDHNPSIPEAPLFTRPKKYPTTTAITTTTTTAPDEPTIIENQPVNDTIANEGLKSNSVNAGTNETPKQNATTDRGVPSISKVSTTLTLLTIFLSFVLYF
ncbi:hypothetical protein PIROE2DRAFT_10861, partial [Piromyces sp. E2]